MTEHSADAGRDFSEDDGIPEEPELELDLHSDNSLGEEQRGAQPPVPRPPLQKPKTGLDAQAEELYQLYPRHCSKPAGLRAIKAALKKIGFGFLRDAVRRFAVQVNNEGRDPKYIPHPATWFNNERWNDLAVLDPKAARIAALKKSIRESPANPHSPNHVDFPLPETKERLRQDLAELKKLEAE